ncbi:MAG: patatin-like phospholipase family protein [Proteobacteria bacterium]|nr:patatin-like phospholipase family protein [Pseudomonadota bacterium]
MLSLALQGGGSFGAFTWGVLDRLLEEDGIVFDAISGTSAGAVNAVVLAAGLAEGGREAARERLERVWRRISGVAAFAPFGSGSPFYAGLPAVASAAFHLSTRFFSPYQFNPLGLNPLRDILAKEVDFDRLRAAAPVRLLIAATRVHDGHLRIFGDGEVTLDAVMASTCLPMLHHAISIDDEWYWDGGYVANPPLMHLAATSEAADIVLVQITPSEYEGRPMLHSQIVKRLQQIALNGPLLKEIEALLTLKELSEREGLFSSHFRRKLRRLRLHQIAAEDTFEGLAQANALSLDWSLLTQLRDSGRAAADAWLATRETREVA